MKASFASFIVKLKALKIIQFYISEASSYNAMLVACTTLILFKSLFFVGILYKVSQFFLTRFLKPLFSDPITKAFFLH